MNKQLWTYTQGLIHLALLFHFILHGINTPNRGFSGFNKWEFHPQHTSFRMSIRAIQFTSRVQQWSRHHLTNSLRNRCFTSDLQRWIYVTENTTDIHSSKGTKKVKQYKWNWQFDGGKARTIIQHLRRLLPSNSFRRIQKLGLTNMQ